MKKIFTLFFIICYSLLSNAQINVGNNQTICLGDAAQVIAATSVQASTDPYQVTSITFAPETTSGTSITFTDDDVEGPFPFGFTFQFYGINYTDFYVGSNGWLGFSSGQPTGYTAVSIPDSTGFGAPINCIMLSWEDLNPATGGQVLYQTIGNAPYRKMVLTEEPYENSFAQSLAGRIQENCFKHLDAPVFVMGSENLPAIPLNSILEETMIPNAEKVSKKIAEILLY